jgi:hypothetical protein
MSSLSVELLKALRIYYRKETLSPKKGTPLGGKKSLKATIQNYHPMR